MSCGQSNYCNSTATAAACGLKATSCIKSQDGQSAVACGGLATQCLSTTSKVACGGSQYANQCAYSGDMHTAACTGGENICLVGK